MVEMGRHTDIELVQDMLKYLKGRKGIVTQGQLCTKLGINSETAEKWLQILHLVKNECPAFEFGKTGKNGIVSVRDYEDLSGPIKGLEPSDAHDFLEEIFEKFFKVVESRIDQTTAKSLRDELLNAFSKETRGLKSIPAEEQQSIIVISEKVKPVLRCKKCGEEQPYPTHCGEPMDFENEEFICTFRNQCGEKINIPVHCKEPMTVIITK